MIPPLKFLEARVGFLSRLHVDADSEQLCRVSVITCTVLLHKCTLTQLVVGSRWTVLSWDSSDIFWMCLVRISAGVLAILNQREFY
jgi:hypothetical protein